MSDRLAEALERLNAFTNYELKSPTEPKAFGLKSAEALWQAFECPSEMIPTIHVAGTNGKGSTVWYAGALVRSTGLKVGTYTSPHLISVCERISVNGVPISEGAFADLAHRVCDQAQKIREEQNIKPTWFDILTVMALLYFAQQEVHVVVLEVGLGGRLDSTNICKPRVTVITRLGLDHVKLLGDNLSAIAMEKAGIIKPEVPLITLAQEDSAMRVLEKLAQVHKAPLKVLGKDFYLSVEEDGMDLDTGSSYHTGLVKEALGYYQWENAALAVMAVEELSKRIGFRLTQQDVRFALVNTQVPGRAQIVEDLLLDCAHNPLSMRTVVDLIRNQGYGPLRLIIGMCQDKNAQETLGLLKSWVAQAWCVPVPSPRSFEPQKLKSEVQQALPGVRVETCTSFDEALKAARSVPDEDPILVTGSFYLVGEALKIALAEEVDKKEAEA